MSSTPIKRILLQGGTVLFHEDNDKINVRRNTDVLIEGSIIKGVGQNLLSGEGVEVVNCHGKIISPGFIDTHHHLWQTQLKGCHAEHTLLDYFPSGNIQSHNFTPEDTYWGQLAGAMEAINVGTTSVLDHAHICRSVEHANKALAATVASGLRSVFAYGIPVRFEQWDGQTCIPSHDLMPEILLQHIEELARKGAQGDGRVHIGFGFDFWFLPKEYVVGTFMRLKAAGVKLFTAHVVKNKAFGTSSIINTIKDYGLLTSPPDIVLSHCTGLEDEEKQILRDSQMPVSATPETESQMAMGWPLSFSPGINFSFGVDCHTSNTSSIMSLARTALLMARQQSNLTVLAKGGFPISLLSDTVEAFNAATIGGARAMGLGEQVGSIQEGKLADLVIFDTLQSLSMSAVGESDPLVAVFRHSDISDIEAVLVNGVWRKRGFKMLPVKDEVTERELTWKNIREKLLVSQKEIFTRQQTASLRRATEMVRQSYQVDQSKLMVLS